MSYIIEPMTIISFLDENKLKLPRFQRKATWNAKQNFELCISVFQEYPVGVVIINKEQKVSWLLDGRQRRNALNLMRSNPIEVYDWARSFLNFRKTEDPIEITNIFWGKISKYLQTESQESGETDEQIEYEQELEEEMEENSFNQENQKKGLQTLLDIIQMVHQKKPSGSAWEKLFDYKQFFAKLQYLRIQNGERKIDPVLLRRHIMQIRKDCDTYNDGELTKEYYIDYFMQNYNCENDKKFKEMINQNWISIENSFNVISRSENVFSEARIGVIWLTNATPLDAQNIFSRINSGGTQLKAEELLSAKPYWNIKVDIIDVCIKDKVYDLYKKLGVEKPESIVRWDIAAILLSRIDVNHLIFDSYEIAKSKNEISLDEITLGFKLLSTIFGGGMSSKHVADLENNDNINWERDIDVLVEELNTIFKILMDTSFFQTFQSWKKPITKLLGNAIALEFITIIYLKWKERNCPTLSSAELKALQRDAIVLFDRLVFEYGTKVWRGSGDSKMANDIKNWKKRIEPIDAKDWKEFIQGACGGIYNGSTMTVKLLKPVLYYYYTITESIPVNQMNVMFDVDHIIPQEKFNDNNMVDVSLKDSLANLALLPKKDNISKKSKALNEIADPWLKSMIEIYTGIKQEMFETYSDISNIVQLKNERQNLFIIAFDINRKTKISN